MKVTYIFHSGFLLESPSAYFLFDYYKGEVPALSAGKPLYIFASHAHGDHFNPAVFALGEARPDTKYILSSDIPAAEVVPGARGKTVFLDPYAAYSDEIVRVETLRSNDLGVAFIVSADGETVFHAGDLNNWYWDEEEDSLALVDEYHRELERIRGRHFDLAFLPLDPRLEDHACDGICDFFAAADADRVYPMHMWKKYKVIDRLKKDPRASGFSGKIQERSFYERGIG